jgi:uncharacterized membrane protein (Fun14 family)
MRLTKSVVENLGKVFLNIGQGIILGAFVTGFLNQTTPSLISVVAFVTGVYTVFVGLQIISEQKHFEE